MKSYRNQKIVFAAFFLLVGVCGTALNAASNQDGWMALVNNKPFEAKKIFIGNLDADDSRVAGEAYRGLAFSCEFLGQSDSCMKLLFEGYMEDGQEIYLGAASQYLIPFARTHPGHHVKKGYKVYRKLSEQETIYNAGFTEDLATRYLNDGKLSKARKLMEPLGIVRDFRMIGPFENISGSGYKKAYPPETELDLTKKYSGKDGTEASWFSFHNKALRGWVFTENNYPATNSVLYYFTNVKSEEEQVVNLGFGASGAFKVFLNDNVVLADSVFRNTGIDMFMQKVRLFKGDNKLLVKLCHEEKHSNFNIRFFDETGRGLESVSYSSEPGKFRQDTTSYADLTNSPVVERIEKHLLSRLEKNGDDMEAALLLAKFYNISEMTDKGQKLAREYIEKYPESSVWHSHLSESLVRSRRITDAQTSIRSAYRLCNYNFEAWLNELQVISTTAGFSDIKEFINSSPEQFQGTLSALLLLFGHYAETENKSELMRLLDHFEDNYLESDVIVDMLATFYSNQGNVRKAQSLLKRYIKHEHTSIEMFSELAGMYLRKGQKKKAVKTLLKGLKYSPGETGIYYYLAKLSLQNRDFDDADKFISEALKLMPSSAAILTLKGSVYSALGEKEKAKKALKQSIRYAYNSFDAWSQLLLLEGKQELQQMVPAPDPGKISQRAQEWEELDNDNGSILSYMKDVFLYPSRCSRERYFLMVHLPTQNAIDIWKEYRIAYNGHYQALNISRAFSKSADGKETPADISQNLVVFKTLAPGDNIVLEWTLENYYQQNMAKQVWGDHEFSLPFPVYDTQLRLVTPSGDTIPYTLQGSSIKVEKEKLQDFMVTRFTRGPYKNPERELYSPVESADVDKVYYSTFPSWSSIVDWYLSITENKLEQTYELRSIVDSLTGGVSDPREKVRRIHKYITGTVMYSYVPFRQSGWIPQAAKEVLSTKIGDCKDMSSLGKSMLDIAGIQSDLVLVNTWDQNSKYPSYIGPNFNHCILSYTIDGKREFVDFTDKYLALGNLPRMDQGSLALIIREGEDSLMHLPVDSPEGRIIKRAVISKLDPDGTLHRRIESTRTGVHAGSYRASNRPLSAGERKKNLQKVVARDYSEAVVDSMKIEGLDDLGNEVYTDYYFTARNAVKMSGNNTAIFELDLIDQISSGDYPSEEKRERDVDMLRSWFGVGIYESKGTLEIPEKWKLVNTPEKVEMSGDWGEYSFELVQEGNRIVYRRKAVFNFRDLVPADECEQLRSLLSGISRTDNVHLVFFT
ncbi:MAG: transglutaminase domain-containing protein, partial [Chitinispirillaceae bacterium]